MLGYVKLPYNNSKRNTTGMGHNCLHVRFFLLDLDSDLDLRSVDLDLDLDLPSLKRTNWTRTWTCSLKVDLDLDLDLRIVDLDLDFDFTVAGLVTSLLCTVEPFCHKMNVCDQSPSECAHSWKSRRSGEYAFSGTKILQC